MYEVNKMNTIKELNEYCILNARNILLGKSRTAGLTVLIGFDKDYNTNVGTLKSVDFSVKRGV